MSSTQPTDREPGRTPTEAEGGDVTPKFPQEETRTQSKAEGDRDTVDESLEQKE
jgi:hypothetical protein